MNFLKKLSKVREIVKNNKINVSDSTVVYIKTKDLLSNKAVQEQLSFIRKHKKAFLNQS